MRDWACPENLGDPDLYVTIEHTQGGSSPMGVIRGLATVIIVAGLVRAFVTTGRSRSERGI
jgi:hypothetical protein